MKIQDVLNYELLKYKKVDIDVGALVNIVIVLFSLWLILFTFKRLFRRLEDKGRIDKGNAFSVFSIVKYFLYVVVVLSILEIVGIKTSIFLASLAALLVGVGLGLQQLFSDVASGVLLLFERNLKVGDIIQLDDGTIGKVLSIGLRTSEINTRDDIIMIIPNSKFINNSIINWSYNDKKTRFSVKVGVAYGSDVSKVKDILLACVSENKDVYKKPEAFVRFTDFGESSLDFELFFWAHQLFNIENLKSDIRFEIDKKFRENNITIPFPQRDVHIKS